MNTENKDEVVLLYLDDIIPNRFQPREVFDEKALKELALSIREHGVIQPIIVRSVTNGKYEIIAGERRYKASALAGLTKIPAIIRNLDDKESSKVALLENLQRKNLNPVEEARTLQKILELDQMTQEELAKSMGKSQSSVANKLRLLNLPDEVLDALLKEQISERHARALLNVPDAKKQKELLKKVINNKLSVRLLEEEISSLFPKDDVKKDDSIPSAASFLNQTPIKPNGFIEEKKEEYGAVKIAPPTTMTGPVPDIINIPQPPQVSNPKDITSQLVNINDDKNNEIKEGEGMAKYVDYNEYENKAELTPPLVPEMPQIPVPIVEISNEEKKVPLVPVPVPEELAKPISEVVNIKEPDKIDLNGPIPDDTPNFSSTSINSKIDIQEIKDKSENIDFNSKKNTASLDDLLNINNKPIKRTIPKSAPTPFPAASMPRKPLTPGEAIVKDAYSQPFNSIKSKEYFDPSDIAQIPLDPALAVINQSSSQNPILTFSDKDITAKEALEKIKVLCEEIEKHGVKITVDEMDFDTIYQIMIRVDK